LQDLHFFKDNYKKAFDKNQINKIDSVGKSNIGGLTHTPFGSSTYNAYWTIGGDNNNRFECGSNHKETGKFIPSDENPNMVFTHHTIWFRGPPPSADVHIKRSMKMK